MSALVFNFFKGQRLDLTVNMKDADAVLGIFQKHHIHFDKKYTTLTGEGPSTITFKGVRATEMLGELAEMIGDLAASAKEEKIGNVYGRWIGAKPKPPVKVEEPPTEATTDIPIVDSTL